MYFFLLFILGISIGSFLNVLIDRLPRGEKIFKDRSHCESCKQDLKWYDLIPLFSFIQLRGKCRYCKSPIGWYYPIVELITGMFFVSVYFKNFQFSMISVLTIPYYLFIIAAFIVIFFTDLKYGIIPNKIVYPAILVTFIFLISQYPNILISNLLSAVGVFLFFFLLMIATEIIFKKSGMGFGDVKLVFFLGLFLGFPKTLVAIYLAFLTGALISIILIVFKKKKFSQGTIPFGPFLVLGTILALFWGEIILQNFILYGFRF